jgi:chaperonin GroES
LSSPQIVAVGPGAIGKDGKALPMHVSVGDRVLLPEYGGHTIKVGEEDLQLYRDEDILAKLQ